MDRSDGWKVDRWIDGWLDGWMDGWMDEEREREIWSVRVV